MNQVIEPTASVNDSHDLNILQQSIFYLAISMVTLVRTGKTRGIVPIRTIIGMPGNERNSKKNYKKLHCLT